MLDTTDTRTDKKKCQDLGVSTLKYQSWLKDPVFKDYLNQRAQQKFGDHTHEADLALLDRVRLGDMKAISYYNEMTGRYVTASARNGSQNVDVRALIVKILEIISDNVHDQDDLLRVSNELRKMIALSNTATALTGYTEESMIVVPEVAELGQLPEGLKESTDKTG